MAKKRNGLIQRYASNLLAPYIKQEAKNVVKKELKKGVAPIAASVEEKSLPIRSNRTFGSSFNARQYAPPDAGTQLSLYEGWVYACIKKIAESTAQIPLNLYQSTKDGAEEIHKHNVI